MLKLHNTKDYFLIQSYEDVQHCVNLISSAGYVAFDTETDGLNVRKNKVIGFSFSTVVNQGYYYPIWEWDGVNLITLPDYGQDHLLKALQQKKLIMHNGAYDTKICFNNLNTDLLSSLHADTMLMRHTLAEEGPFALKDIAVQLSSEIGISQDEVANQEQLELEENVKAKGGSWKKSNKEMYKADLNILAKYACADTDLCLRLFYYFESQLDAEKLSSFFYKEEVMPVYTLVTIPMEFEGVYIDMPKLIQYLEAIKKMIADIENDITYKLLNCEHGVQFVEQRASSEYEVKPSGSFAQAVVEYYKLDLPKSASGKYSITKKNLESLEDSPALTFLQTGDATQIDCFAIQKLLLEADGPLINLSSKQQLAKYVFEIMNIEPETKTDKGAPQFNEAMIEKLASEYEVDWAKELRVYNKLNKIKSSYYDRFLEQQEGGIFYPSFKQHATTSGRWASDFQQLSRTVEDGSDDSRVVYFTNTIRELIIPKPGYLFIDDDYESLEPRVFASDANEKALIEIFELGEDFYSKVAIMTEGLKDVSAHKKDPNFLKNKYPDVRQAAKAYSLGIRYGMKAFKLSHALNIDPEDAQEKIDNYFKAFPNLKLAMDKYLTQAKTEGKVISEFGRVRHLPRAKAIYDKYGDDILEYSNLSKLCKKFYKPMADLKDLRKEYNNLLNNALNFPIQSAANSIVARAGVAMTQKFREEGLDAWASLVVHDQWVVSCRKDHIDRVKTIVQDCMENTTKLKMKLIAKPEIASNLRDGHG